MSKRGLAIVGIGETTYCRKPGSGMSQLGIQLQAACRAIEDAGLEREQIDEVVLVGGMTRMPRIQEKVSEIFVALGYEVADGPEVEAEWYNFDALNIPRDHPARDLWDTIYVEPPEGAAEREDRLLLRTHTSPGQIRAMRDAEPPIRVLTPGRCYRYEAVDASHGFEFFQVEGLMVDEGTSMATPHVSGAVAMMLSRARDTGTSLPPDVARSTFVASCSNCGTCTKGHAVALGWATAIWLATINTPTRLR